ncbi:MAG: hypothetical protein V1847_05315 [Candidatus Diapherotrites archaeon]
MGLESLRVSFFVLAVLALASFAFSASVSDSLGVQGKLTNTAGVVLTGDYDFVFRIYTASAGGTPIYIEHHDAANGNAVSVSAGLYSVILGDNNSVKDLNTDGNLWLGIKVGTNAEMTPRVRLASVPSSFKTNYTFQQDLNTYRDLNLTRDANIAGKLSVGSAGLLGLSTGDLNISGKYFGSFAGSIQSASDINSIYYRQSDANSVLVKWSLLSGCDSNSSCLITGRVGSASDINAQFVRQTDGNAWYGRVGVTGLTSFLLNADFNSLYARLSVAPITSFLFNADFNGLYYRQSDANTVLVKWSLLPTCDANSSCNITGKIASSSDGNNTWIKISDSNNVSRLDQKVIRDLNLAFYAQSDANAVFIKISDSNNVARLQSRVVRDWNTIASLKQFMIADANNAGWLSTTAIAGYVASRADTTLDSNGDANASFARKDNNISGYWDFNIGLRAQDLNVRGKILTNNATAVGVANGDINASGGVKAVDLNASRNLLVGSASARDLNSGDVNVSGAIVGRNYLLLQGTSGTTPVGGAGTRMMWIPAKGAFRAGEVTSNHWDNDNIGSYSVAMGYDTNAKGFASVALGGYTNAIGSESFAMGNTTSAVGETSTAIGYMATSNGVYSMVFGTGIDTSNKLINNLSYSLAVGFNTTVPTLFVGPGTGAGTAGNVSINGDVNIGTATRTGLSSGDLNASGGVKAQDLNASRNLIVGSATAVGLSAGDANISGELSVRDDLNVGTAGTGSTSSYTLAINPNIRSTIGSGSKIIMKTSEGGTSNFREFSITNNLNLSGSASAVIDFNIDVKDQGSPYFRFGGGDVNLERNLRVETGKIILGSATTTDLSNGDLNASGVVKALDLNASRNLIVGSATAVGLSAGDANVGNNLYVQGTFSLTDLNAKRDVNVLRYLLLGGARATNLSNGDVNAAGGVKALDLNASRNVIVGSAKAANLSFGDLNVSGVVKALDLNAARNLLVGKATGAGLDFGDANIDGNVFIRGGLTVGGASNIGNDSNDLNVQDFIGAEQLRIRSHARIFGILRTGNASSTGLSDADVNVEGGLTAMDLNARRNVKFSGLGTSPGGESFLCISATGVVSKLDGGCNVASPFVKSADGKKYYSEVLANLWKFEATTYNRIDNFSFNDKPRFSYADEKQETEFTDYIALGLRCYNNNTAYVKKQYKPVFADKGFEALAKSDDVYQVLNQGESSIIEFEQPNSKDAIGCEKTDFVIIAEGYYENTANEAELLNRAKGT